MRHPEVSALSRSAWWQRLARRLRLRLGSTRLRLAWSSGYTFRLPGGLHDPDRGERILAFLAEERLVRLDRVLRPEPIGWEDLRTVHSDAYLESLHEPGGLARIFGVDLTEVQQDRLIEAQRTMAAGTAMAVEVALPRRGIAWNLGGGFHHALLDKGQGFCLFNDLAVAVQRLRRSGFAGPVLIVDLDLHDGDGTRSIFARDPTVHTLSIHNAPWGDEEAVASTSLSLGAGVDDERLLATLREHLPPLAAAFRPELVLYVAGCDPAADDRLGNWRLTLEGIFRRDRFVFETFRRQRRPPAFVGVLAGGYGEHAWRYTARFLGWVASRQRIEPPSTEKMTLDLYRRQARALSPADLQGARAGDDWSLSYEDLAGTLGSSAQESRLAGFYTRQGVELALERYGFLGKVRQLGFQPVVSFELDHPGGQTVRIHGDPARRELIMELRLRRDRRALPGSELLFVEWLLLQNPRGTFSPSRPALPGQRAPGLGLLRDVMSLLVMVCERIGFAAVAFVPSHFHLAAQSHDVLCFLEPAAEARYRAFAAALAPLPLGEASRAAGDGRVIDEATGGPVRWQGSPMVLAVEETLRDRLAGAGWRDEVERLTAGLRYRLAEPSSDLRRDGRQSPPAP